MTITTQTPRAQYNGNGVTTAFSTVFEFLEGSTLKVIVTSAAGVDTVQTLTTHYTVSGGGTTQPAIGTVTMLTPPASGEKLTILRDQPVTQAASYTPNDPFAAKTHEKALDRLAMQIQMLKERLGRALLFKDSSAQTGVTFPEPSADKVIGWNSAGDGLESKTVSLLGGVEVVDEDDMASNSATKVPSQQSVKTYVDGRVLDEDNMASDSATRPPSQQSVKAYVDAGPASSALQGVMRDRLDVAPYVATRTILKALDTTKDKVSSLTESGREGLFDWKAGDYSTQIAADPLEACFIKADAIASTAGAWVRRAGFAVFGINAAWAGAAPGAAMATNTAGIQAALNLASAIGAPKVLVSSGEHLLGYTSETFETTAMPAPQALDYGLLVPSGVTLQGIGRGTVLKRGTTTAMVVVVMPYGNGSQIRNLRIDGDNTTNPITGETYGSGMGLNVESTSLTEDKDTIIDTVWIEDTPGYGIGCEWGNHNGLTIRNVFINGTGSDGIDIKRMNSGAFVAKRLVLDNIHVTNFGRTATDVATQAGVDLRGWVTATNIHVYGVWGAQASSGIRMHATGGGVVGGHHATVSNFFIECTSGGVATTYGAHNNGANAGAFSNGVAMGCDVNFYADGVAALFNACRSLDAVAYGFTAVANASGAQFIGCSAKGGTYSFYIAGDDTVLVAPVCETATTGIEVISGALRTQVASPVYLSCTTDITNAEPTTIITPREVLATVATSDFVGTDGTSAQPLFTAAQDALTVRAGVTYEMEGTFYIARSAGTTSHTTSLLFGGTATVSGITYLAMVSNPNFNVLGAQSAIRIQALTAVAITAANTSANEALAIHVKGVVTVSAGGTLIPQFQYSAAPGGAPTIMARSYFKLTAIAAPRQGNVG